MPVKTTTLFAAVFLASLSLSIASADDDDKGVQIGSTPPTSHTLFVQPIEDFFIAESVRVQDAHELQATLALNGSRSFRQVNASSEIEYGLTDRWQISVDTPAFIGSPRGSTADFEAATEYSLLASNQPFALSAYFGIGKTDTDLSTPDGQRNWQITPGLVIGKAFGKFQLQLSASAQLSSMTQFAYNAATVYNAGRFCPTLEINGNASHDGQTLLLTPGTYYHLQHNQEVGIAFPMRLQNGEDAPEFVGKFTIEY